MRVAARVLGVVVLYGMAPEQSRTIVGLAQAFADNPTLPARVDVLVWDNSPEAHDPERIPLRCAYHHADANEGVSGAYNSAARMAASAGAEWLLLLDQDTSVTAAYLRALLRELGSVAVDETIATVVPYLYAGDFQLSPRLWRFARHVPLPRPAAPYAERREIFAANSGMLVRVAALDAVGGYSPRFWLDYSDIEFFHRLHKRGYAAWIVPDASLQHEVAMLDYDGRMTPARYAIYLAAESDFLDLYRGTAERLLHLGRLAMRILRQRPLRNPEFSQMTARELRRRITVRRRTRLQERAALSRDVS